MRIQETSVVDRIHPNTNSDPAFQVIPDPDRIRIQVFDDQKLRKKYIWIFFWSKIAIYLSLGLHKGRPSYRRSLQPSKENIQHINLFNFFLFLWVKIKVHAPSVYGQTIISKRKEKRAESARTPPFSKLLSVFWIVWLIVFSISYYRECH